MANYRETPIKTACSNRWYIYPTIQLCQNIYPFVSQHHLRTRVKQPWGIVLRSVLLHGRILLNKYYSHFRNANTRINYLGSELSQFTCACYFWVFVAKLLSSRLIKSVLISTTAGDLIRALYESGRENNVTYLCLGRTGQQILHESCNIAS